MTPTITTIREAAMRDICENIADDAPRLEFADFLEENGESERAAFIRVQCEIPGLDREEVELFNSETDWSECTGIAASWCPNCGDCACKSREDSMNDKECLLHNPKSKHCCLDDLNHKRETLRRRERELLSANWHDWLSSGGMSHYFATNRNKDEYGWLIKPQGEDGRIINCVLRRGFVAEITCTCAEFLKHAEALFRCNPIERVTLGDSQPWEYEFRGEKLFRWNGDGEFADQTGGGTLVCAMGGLPRDIVKRLKRHRRFKADDIRVGKIAQCLMYTYPTVSEAMQELSAACVSYGRSLVRLPAIDSARRL